MVLIRHDKIRSFSISTEKSKKTGLTSYNIRYRDINGSMRRLNHELYPRFKNKEEAQEWIRTESAHLAGLKAERERIKLNNQKYPRLTDKLNLFIEYKKTKIKEHKTLESYFNNYIFNFYLNIKNITLFESWHLEHDELLVYLQTTKSKKGTPLSPETIRKICHYLNDFYGFLESKNLTSKQLIKIEVKPTGDDNQRAMINAYWTTEAFNLIMPQLSDESREFCTLLYHTGLRVNELMGLSRRDITMGQIKQIHQLLVSYQVDYVGYITLKGQLDSSDGLNYTLKPFKSKTSLHSKYYRVIPISKETLDLIRDRLDRLNIPKFDPLINTEEESINLIFKGVNPTKVLRELQSVCRLNNLSDKTILHYFRHTYVTNMLIKCNDDFNLISKFTGHSSLRVMSRYSYFIELMVGNSTDNEIADL